MLNRKGQKGFTLIELLIVVAIFSILLSFYYNSTNSIYRTHYINTSDQKILWVLSSQEAVLRAIPYNDLYPGQHPFASILMENLNIPDAVTYFTTAEINPRLKKIDLFASYPDRANSPGTTSEAQPRTMSVVMYRSKQ